MLTTEYSDVAFNDLLDKVMDFYDDKIHEQLLLIDIREPEEIQRAAEVFDAITVFIKNDNVPEITSNEADANVEDFEYDYYIENNGTIEEFEKSVRTFYYNILMRL